MRVHTCPVYTLMGQLTALPGSRPIHWQEWGGVCIQNHLGCSLTSQVAWAATLTSRSTCSPQVDCVHSLRPPGHQHALAGPWSEVLAGRSHGDQPEESLPQPESQRRSSSGPGFHPSLSALFPGLHVLLTSPHPLRSRFPLEPSALTLSVSSPW